MNRLLYTLSGRAFKSPLRRRRLLLKSICPTCMTPAAIPVTNAQVVNGGTSNGLSGSSAPSKYGWNFSSAQSTRRRFFMAESRGVILPNARCRSDPFICTPHSGSQRRSRSGRPTGFSQGCDALRPTGRFRRDPARGCAGTIQDDA
jgi:hypothetical protein